MIGKIAEVVVAAMANGGEEQAAADFVLENISQRMAAQLREEIGDAGKPKASAAEAAQTRMVTAIREAADSGEIEMVDEDEDAA